MEAAAKAPAAIHKLNKDIGMAANLAELGVKEFDLEVVAKNAMNDGTRLTNPRQPITFEVMLFIIRSAMGVPFAKAAGGVKSQHCTERKLFQQMWFAAGSWSQAI